MTRAEALEILDTIPTIGDQVDALEMAIKALEKEPIIYCKDCKHWGGVILGNKCTMLSGLGYVLATKENCFCSFGEQKESVGMK